MSVFQSGPVPQDFLHVHEQDSEALVLENGPLCHLSDAFLR